MSHRPRFLSLLLGLWLAGFAVLRALPSDALPTRPDRYFTDRAGIVSPATAAQLNHELADFERETSDQLLVAIFPRVPEGAASEDFTIRTAHAWQVGQKGKNNSAILFVFVADHYVRIEVGYGLEPVLTDATSSLIIHNIITPAFRRGDYSAGLTSGVHAMMQACRGEFKGTGATHAQATGETGNRVSFFGVGLFVVFMWIFGWLARRRRGWTSTSPYADRTRTFGSGPWIVGGGGFDSGSNSSSRSSNDSFSGGGGDFGGGGAGGNW